MTLVKPQGGKSTAGNIAVAGSARLFRGVVALGVLALLGGATSAHGLTITGGPVYNLPGGGSCVVSGDPSKTSGATLTCSGVTLSAHSNIYFGIKNNTDANGNTMTGATPSGGAIFRYNTNTTSVITYTSTTTINNTLGSSAQAVNNRLQLGASAGTLTIVSTGGTPANNGNGDIERLFKVGSSSFTVSVNVDSNTTGIPSFDNSNPQVYDPVHTPLAGTVDDISKVDVAFYFSDCGDGVIDSPEVCDDGVANGTLGSCCTTSCTFKSNGTACTDDGNLCTDDQCNGVSSVCMHPANSAPCNDGLFCNGADTCSGGSCLLHAGDPCPGPDGDTNCAESCNETLDNCLGDDPNGSTCRPAAGTCDVVETCVTGTCPSDGFETAGTTCRPGSGDSCDPTEVCTGASPTCPVDVVTPGGTLCRAGSGDICDANETCTGTATLPCPADDAPGNAGLVCNPGSGDLCDPSETCTGTPLATCPSDTVATAGTVCNPGSGDSCDPDEVCSGVADVPCPLDTFEPNTTVCNPGSGDSCDPDEFCPGTADGACPSDTIATVGTVCNPGSGDSCDPDEVCSGTADDPCPSDTVTSAGTVCNPGSGDSCDPDEVCSGTADDPCPSDTIATAGTVCNPGSGDSCDPDEVCSGTADDPCPSDTIASAGTVCNPGSGDSCDPDEVCSGSADDPCPADSFASSSTICRGSAFSCDAVEFCPGAADGMCPVDILELDGTSCNDGDSCTQSTTCLAGVCQGGVPDLCVDNFKCYKAKDLKAPKFIATTVSLLDQFGPLLHEDTNFQLKKPFLVCNPADLGSGIENLADHLTCYKVRGRDGKIDKSQRPTVRAHNQLGTVDLELTKAFVVCVPSAKTIIP